MKRPDSVSEKMSSHHHLAMPVALLAVLLGTRFGGLFSLPPGNISAFWPANALLFSAVFLLPPRQGAMTLLLALLAYAGAELWIGYSLQNAVIFGIANVIEVAVLLWLFRRTGVRSLGFDRLRDLFLLFSFALLASPVGGAIGALEATRDGGAFWTVFLRWSLADFFGYCLCVPLVLTWPQWRRTLAFESPARMVELATLLVVLAFVSVLSSGVQLMGLTAPLGAQFLPLPVLLWAALRFGPPGGAIATVIVASVAFFSATHGAGLFAAGAPEENVASLQLFFAALVISVMTIASLNAERKTSFESMQQEVFERKQAEEALKKSESLLNATQRLTRVGGWEYDVKSGKSFWTEELYRIHEMPNDPGMDHVKESMACYGPEERRILKEAFQRACEKGESYDLELPFTTRQGKSLWIRTTAQPVFAEGKVVRLVGNLMDLTERKRAEDALRSSSERLQLATRVASIGIWDWDIPRNELVWDESMYQLYGIRRGDFGGAYDAWIQTIHPDDKEHTDGEIQAALRGEREYGPEFRIIRPDGSIRYIKADSQTFKDQSGKPLRMIGTNIDITERKQAEAELRHYKDQLEETVQRRTAELLLARDAAEAANKAKSVFLANMSHELRTPLNAILGFSSLIQRDPQLSKAQRENVEVINRSGAHLLALINDVLEIAKIEAGRVQLETAPFDLGALLRDVVDMMQLRANEKGLSLQVDQSSDFPRYIKGDEARLRQILINLVGNAVKFTKEGGVVVRLGVRKNDRLHMLIEVEDSGPGISTEDQKRLFKPFIQLAEGGAQKGTGLGLAITRQFVDLMQGTISVNSALGKGSVFRVDLPVEPAAAASVPELASAVHGEVIGLADGQPRYRVLIAEDQAENQQLLSWLMSDIGIEARVADNGEQCVKIFQEWQPDLIWMDRRMPVMEGEEATRRIRKLPGGDKVKIVAVTASAFKEEQQEMLDAGMDDFIRKPYRPDEIYDCFARLLNVEYRYSAAPADEAPKALTAAMLSKLPAPLRQELRTAVTSLDHDRIAGALDKIGAVDAELARTLSRLTEYFDYPAILKVLDATEGQPEAP